jgi:hypothetical protein
MTTEPNFLPMQVVERLLAEAAVVADIECEGEPVERLGPKAYDVRPMLDEREHHPLSIDMNALALAYAQWRGLIEVLERDAAGQPAIVRVVRLPL